MAKYHDADLAADPDEHPFHIPKSAFWPEVKQHTTNIGELWEERSPDKKALFFMAIKEDAQGRKVYQQIEAKIGIS